MLPYRHTQPGTLVRWVLASGLPIVGLLLAASPRGVPPGLPAFLGLVLGACLLLFWSLTVEVDATALRFRFGPGLIRKSVPIDAIEACESVKAPPAWGIHWAGKRGWLYNVSGSGAVALRLKGGRALMLGSDEPEALCRAIEAARQSRR
jgi:hypothetical protein